jgi:hypothetical protein
LVEVAYFTRFGENVRNSMREIRQMLEEDEWRTRRARSEGPNTPRTVEKAGTCRAEKEKSQLILTRTEGRNRGLCPLRDGVHSYLLTSQREFVEGRSYND